MRHLKTGILNLNLPHPKDVIIASSSPLQKRNQSLPKKQLFVCLVQVRSQVLQVCQELAHYCSLWLEAGKHSLSLLVCFSPHQPQRAAMRRFHTQKQTWTSHMLYQNCFQTICLSLTREKTSLMKTNWLVCEMYIWFTSPPDTAWGTVQDASH